MWSSAADSKPDLITCGGSFDRFLSDLSKRGEEIGLPQHAVKKSINNTDYVNRVLELDRSQAAFSMGFVDFTKNLYLNPASGVGKYTSTAESTLFIK